ncbi:MAG: HAD family hydrolase [Sulfurovum sp.]
MPNKIFFFSDIDDTLIQTRRKTDFTKETVVGGYTKDGEENSFFYKGTKLFIDTIIKSGMTFIPTTARNMDSYDRTILSKDKNIKYAILNFGGVVLIDGKVDEDWQKQIMQEYNKILSMQEVYKILQKELMRANVELVIKVLDEFYLSIYNKFNLNNKGVLNSVREILNEFLEIYTDFYLYENDNSFAILPKCLNKKFAVEYLIERYNPILTLGAGDNISDMDFMNLADFKIIPQKVGVSLIGVDNV